MPARRSPPAQQPELSPSPDGLGARVGLQLAVGGRDLGLDGVAGDVQLLRDLTERQVRRKELQDADLRSRQCHRARQPRGPARAGDQVGQLLELVPQHAFGHQVAEGLLGLLDPRSGRERFAGLERGAPQHDAHLRGIPGHGLGRSACRADPLHGGDVTPHGGEITRTSRRPCGHCVGQHGLEVVLQARLLEQREGRGAVGVRPALPRGQRQDGELGVREGSGALLVRQPEFHRLRQHRAGELRTAAENVGRAEQGERHRPLRRPWGFELDGAPGVLGHALHALRREEGGEQGGGRLQRAAAVGKGAGRVGGTGDTKSALRPDGMPAERPDPSRGDRERRVRGERRIVQPAKPVEHGAATPGGEGLSRPQVDQPCGSEQVPAREGMRDRLVGQALLLEPGRGPAVQPHLLAGFAQAQLAEQHLPEQPVIAIPPALPVGSSDGDDEEVASCCLPQARLGSGRLEDGVAHGSGHPVEDGGPQQEPHVVQGWA